MSRSQRRIDPAKEIAVLENRHQKLKAKVAAYEARRVLTSEEEFALQKLKKEKLRMKDALQQKRS